MIQTQSLQAQEFSFSITVPLYAYPRELEHSFISVPTSVLGQPHHCLTMGSGLERILRTSSLLRIQSVSYFAKLQRRKDHTLTIKQEELNGEKKKTNVVYSLYCQKILHIAQ